LLNRFRSKLALEGLDMGPVLEGFIERYVAGAESAQPGTLVITPGGESTVVKDVLTVVRSGGEAAELLKRTASSLVLMVRAGGSDAMAYAQREHGNGDWLEPGSPDPKDRPGDPVTERRIEEAERVAEEIKREAKETGQPAIRRSADAAGLHRGRKRVGD